MSQITRGRLIASQMRVRLEGVWDQAGVVGLRVESVRVGAETRELRGAGGDWSGAAGMLGLMLRCVVVVAVAVTVDVRGARFAGDGLIVGSVTGASKSLGWLRVATILEVLPNVRGELRVANVIVLELAHGRWELEAACDQPHSQPRHQNNTTSQQ